MRFAILTPPPDYAAEWRWAFDVEAEALNAAGATIEPVPWTDATELTGFDLILPLVAWGYHQRPAQWLELLDRFERDGARVINPVPLLRWNSDKAYLAELGARGVSTVLTLAVDSLDEAALGAARDRFECSELVVKPPISASAYATFRLREGDPFPEQVRGWPMMIQPWIEAIVDSGEHSLMFFGGAFSHAVSKVPSTGDFRVQPEHGGIIERCEPPEGSVALAQAALAAAPAESAYARVDLVVGNDGALQVIELELIEPALFLEHAPERGPAFAEAIIAAARRG